MSKSFEQINKGLSSNYKKPGCEISQGKDALIIKLKLPGIDRKEVILNVTPDFIEVLAEKKGRKEIRSKESYSREERFVGYRRVISLPPGLITDKSDAKFSKEKLIIRIPKVKSGKVKIK